MSLSTTRVLADLITASRLPSFRIGSVLAASAALPAEATATASVSTVASDASAPATAGGAAANSVFKSVAAPIPVPAAPAEVAPGSDWNLDALTGRLVELSSSGPSVALTAVSTLVLEAQLRREPAAWVAIGEATFYPPDLAEAGCDLENLPVVRVPDARTAARAADLLLRSGGFRVVVIDGVGSPYVRTRRFDPGRSRFYPGYGPSYSQNADRRAADVREDHPGQGRDVRQYVPNEMRSRGLSGGALADGTGARSRAASSRRGRFDDSYHRESSASIPPAAQTRLAGLTKRHQAVLVCLTYKERGASSLGALVSLRGTGRVRKTAFDRFTWELEALKDKRRAPGWEHSGVCRGPTGLF